MAGPGTARLRLEAESSWSSGMDSSKSVQASASFTKADASCGLMLPAISLALSETASSDPASSAPAACASRVAYNTCHTCQAGRCGSNMEAILEQVMSLCTFQTTSISMICDQITATMVWPTKKAVELGNCIGRSGGILLTIASGGLAGIQFC